MFSAGINHEYVLVLILNMPFMTSDIIFNMSYNDSQKYGNTKLCSNMFLIIIIKYSRIQTKVFVCLQYRAEKSLLIKKKNNL